VEAVDFLSSRQREEDDMAKRHKARDTRGRFVPLFSKRLLRSFKIRGGVL
jgi:hypothetical protein